MSFARKLKRNIAKKNPDPSSSAERSKTEAGDRVLDWASSTRQLSDYVRKVIRFIAENTGKLIGPMDLCFPVVHENQREWIGHLSVSPMEFGYKKDGYVSGGPILVADLLEVAPFFRAQILGEMKEGVRAKPKNQSTIFLVHEDGEVEFFYFEMASSDRAEVTDDMPMAGNSGFELPVLREDEAARLLLHLGQHHRDAADRDHDDVGVDRPIIHAHHPLEGGHTVGDGHELCVEQLLHVRRLHASQRDGVPFSFNTGRNWDRGHDEDRPSNEESVRDLAVLAHFSLPSSHFLTTAVQDHFCLMANELAMA